MIRGTVNEGISSASKQTIDPGTGHIGTGIKGQSYETVEVLADGSVTEGRDEFGTHPTTRSIYPSNRFNGTFE